MKNKKIVNLEGFGKPIKKKSHLVIFRSINQARNRISEIPGTACIYGGCRFYGDKIRQSLRYVRESGPFNHEWVSEWVRCQSVTLRFFFGTMRDCNFPKASGNLYVCSGGEGAINKHARATNIARSMGRWRNKRNSKINWFVKFPGQWPSITPVIILERAFMYFFDWIFLPHRLRRYRLRNRTRNFNSRATFDPQYRSSFRLDHRRGSVVVANLPRYHDYYAATDPKIPIDFSYLTWILVIDLRK